MSSKDRVTIHHRAFDTNRPSARMRPFYTITGEAGSNVFPSVDGQEALDILRGSSAHSAIDRPYLVTLDINMPRMNGHEFLAEVRKDPSLKNAIIFVLTTSDAPEDIARAYSQNVAGYIVKDDLQDSFVNALRLLDAYSETVALPH